MSKPFDGVCMLCHEIKEVRHIDLYIVGSEGLFLCHECEMVVVALIRNLIYEKARERLEARKRIRKTEGIPSLGIEEGEN